MKTKYKCEECELMCEVCFKDAEETEYYPICPFFDDEYSKSSGFYYSFKKEEVK